MNNKPIAYIGLALTLAGFLSAVGLVAFGRSVEWLRDSGEGAAWGAFAMCIVGCAFGLVNCGGQRQGKWQPRSAACWWPCS
jgi:hypothetical protein